MLQKDYYLLEDGTDGAFDYYRWFHYFNPIHALVLLRILDGEPGVRFISSA